MQVCKRRTGERMTYQVLAERTGITQGTLQIIGSRDDYNATLATMEKICRALEVPLHVMLELIADPPKRKRAKNRQRGVARYANRNYEIFWGKQCRNTTAHGDRVAAYLRSGFC